MMQKKKSEIIDTYYNPITKTYQVLDDKQGKKNSKKRKNVFLGIVVFIVLVLVAIQLIINVRNINDTAWRLGCMDGGLKPDQCAAIQKSNKNQ